MPTQTVLIGQTIVPGPLAPLPPKVFIDDPELRQHAGTPWLLRHLLDRHGLDLRHDAMPVSEALFMDRKLLAKHALIIGSTGAGKTRSVLHLLDAQLRAGSSAVVIDFKPDTIREAVAVARDAGLPDARIDVLWTGDPHRGIPGWNPLAVSLGDADRAAGSLKDIFASAYKDSWGPRMDDLLENAATVIAAQRLSVLELVRFLQNPAYREGLIASLRGSEAWRRFPEQHEYFASEFFAMGKGAQDTAVQPVLNKVRVLIRNPYLLALLTARGDTLRLADLWKRQRVVLVHLDKTELGKDAAQILSGMLVHRLYALCMTRPGDVPVTLVLDELGEQERFLGASIRDIVERGRQQLLWLITAGQHFGQISDDLRALFLGNYGFMAFLRLSLDDAKRVAAIALTGTGERPVRVELSLPKTERPYESISLPVVTPTGEALRMEEKEYQQIARTTGTALGDAIALWARHADHGRAYVDLPWGSHPEVRAFLSSMGASTVGMEGHAPLRLALRFPRPQVRETEKDTESQRVAALAGAIVKFADFEAVVLVASRSAAHVRLATMPFRDTLPRVDGFLRGQSREEITATYEERQEAIARLSGQLAQPRGTRKAVPLPEPEAADDGSF